MNHVSRVADAIDVCLRELIMQWKGQKELTEFGKQVVHGVTLGRATKSSLLFCWMLERQGNGEVAQVPDHPVFPIPYVVRRIG